MRSLKLIFVILLIFDGQSLLSQNSHQLKPIEPLSKDWEEWLNNRPVSGDLRVGLMSVTSRKINDFTKFYVYLPKPTKYLLCVQIRTQDGKYNAALSYKLNSSTGVVELELPTKYSKKLSAYDPKEISILSLLKEDCNTETQAYLLSSWNKELDKNNAYLNILSRRPVKLLVVKGGKIGFEVNCEQELFKDKPLVTFNRVCFLPKEILSDSTKVYLRVSSGRITSSPKDYPVPVWF